MKLFRKRKLGSAIIYIVFIQLIFVYESIADTNKGNNAVSYLITIDEDNPKLTSVKMSFTLNDSILYMHFGANDFPKRWATFVQNIEAVNEKGKPIVIEELPDAKWKVHAPLNKKITLTYEVKLDHEDHKWSGGVDGVAYAKDWGIFYTGRALFIMNGEERDRITIDFSLPEKWKVTTPWSREKSNANVFIANNLTEVAESMIFAESKFEINYFNLL